MKLSTLANRALAIKLLAAVTTYGFTIILARTMLADGFGWVAFFLNLSLILAVIGARGQQLAALRFVPIIRKRDQRGGLPAFIRFSIRTSAIGTLSVWSGAILVAIIVYQLDRINSISLVDLVLGLSLIPLLGWIDLQSHWARGCNLLFLSLIPKDILWRAIVSGVVVAIFLLQDRTPVDTTKVLLALVSALGALAIIQAGILATKTSLFAQTDGTSNHISEWQTSAGPFWVTSVSNIFMGTADVVIVGLFAGPATAGVYFAANRLAMLLSFFSTSYNIALAPLLATAWNSGNNAEVSQLLQQSTFKTTIPTAAAGIILAFFAPQFLALFGPEFSNAVPPLRILVVAALVNALTGPADIALNMCGFHRQAKHASMVSLVVSVIFLTTGALVAGPTGIATAILISTLVRKGMFWSLALKLLSVRTDFLAGVRACRQEKYRFDEHN